jgi:lysophospholipid acyltransferase (LPLAT)-like uncharacterized protein
MRVWAYRMGMPIALGLVRFLWWSYRIERVIGDDRLTTALRESGAVIPCMWHQHMMLAVRYLLNKRAAGMKLGFMISPSVDGEAGAMAAQRIGAYVVRGSSSHTGARALRDFYMAVVKENISLLVTPDGPRGPRYDAKPGVLLIGQLSGKPVVPIAYAASRVFKFPVWDRFILPLPFARIVLTIGEPMRIPKVMNPDDLEAQRQALNSSLRNLYTEAHAALS